MKSTLFSAVLLSGALLLGACNNNKGEVGTEGMNAAAVDANATAAPVVDNPNVTGDMAAPNPNAPVMTFAVADHDFGDIQPGAVVKHTFEFTNTGKSPLHHRKCYRQLRLHHAQLDQGAHSARRQRHD